MVVVVPPRIEGGAPPSDAPPIARSLSGELALAAGRSAEALTHFRAVLTHPPVAYVPDSYDDCLASARLRLGRFDEGSSSISVCLASTRTRRARYGLAQALERAGRRGEARAEYLNFLGIWSQADPDVPELLDTKRRVAALTAGSQVIV